MLWDRYGLDRLVKHFFSSYNNYESHSTLCNLDRSLSFHHRGSVFLVDGHCCEYNNNSDEEQE